MKNIRFSTTFLFATIVVASVIMAVTTSRYRKQLHAVQAIEELGARISYTEPHGFWAWLKPLFTPVYGEKATEDIYSIQFGGLFFDEEHSEVGMISTNIHSLNGIDWSAFTRIRALDLSGTKISDRDMLCVRQLRALEMLIIDSTSISDDGLQLLRNLPRLAVISAVATNVRNTSELKKVLPQCSVKIEPSSIR